MENNKKMLILIAIIIGVVMLIVLIIWLSFGRRSPAKDTGDLKTLSQYAMITYTTQDQNNFYYLDKDHLTFYKINLLDQEPQKIIKNDVYYIEKVNWSPGKTKAILKVLNYKDSDYAFVVNDFEAGKIYNLKPEVIDALWDTDGNIIMISKENDNYKIIQSLSDITKEKTILDLETNRCDQILVLGKGLDKAICLSIQSDIAALLKTINISGKEIKALEGDYTTGKPNPDNSLLVALKNEENQSLFVIMDINGAIKQKITLDIDVYQIDKTAWSPDGSFLIIAVGEDQTNSDALYKINVANGEKSKIKFDPGSLKIDAQNLTVSPDNKTLYFTSNDILYKLDLKT